MSQTTRTKRMRRLQTVFIVGLFWFESIQSHIMVKGMGYVLSHEVKGRILGHLKGSCDLKSSKDY